MRKKPLARENEKTTKQLRLYRETLQSLQSPDESALRHVVGGAETARTGTFACCQYH